MSGFGQLKIYQKAFGYSYSFGVFPTVELLTHRPEQVQRVVAHSKGERSSGLGKLKELCAAHGLPFEVNDRAVERLSHKGNVYVFGVFDKYAAPLSADKNHLLLVNPSDNGNLGTIARTLLAFGVRDLALLEPAVDIFNPHVVRASMGATICAPVWVFQLAGGVPVGLYAHALSFYVRRFGRAGDRNLSPALHARFRA